MIYLTTLNNETSTLLTILMFASVIVLTTATLCQYFGRRKLKFDIFVFRNIFHFGLHLFQLKQHNQAHCTLCHAWLFCGCCVVV